MKNQKLHRKPKVKQKTKGYIEKSKFIQETRLNIENKIKYKKPKVTQKIKVYIGNKIKYREQD